MLSISTPSRLSTITQMSTVRRADRRARLGRPEMTSVAGTAPRGARRAKAANIDFSRGSAACRTCPRARWRRGRLTVAAGMLGGVATRVSSPVLVGRSGQLSVLDTALAEAGRGNPSAVLVGGEAGVGKSRLVSDFAERCRSEDVRVLAGGCLELGVDGLPFAPFTAMLRGLVRDLGPEGVAALLPGGTTRELARLLPEFGEPAGTGDAGEARVRLFEQVRPARTAG